MNRQPNLVREPDFFDLIGDIGDANFVGVIQRNRNFETIYEPQYQMSGLLGRAGEE